MSKNTHTGVGSDRRPVNRGNVKKRIRQQQKMAAFFASKKEEAK